jgi:hypothetical protein
MAIAVIAGLSFATVLTLGMVPVMYSLLDDLGDFFRRHYAHADDGAGAEPVPPPEPSARPRSRSVKELVLRFKGTRAASRA